VAREKPVEVKSYRLTPAADKDLLEIWIYIADDNPSAADDVENDILAACQRVADRPDLGHFRRDLTDRPLRFFAVRQKYLLVYDPATEPLQVVRILHGSRDANAELDG
jgi:plasmid stabilization system protein ParE